MDDDNKLRDTLTTLLDKADTLLKQENGEFYVILVGRAEDDGYTRALGSNLPAKLMRRVMDLSPQADETTERRVSAYNTQSKKIAEVTDPKAADALIGELFEPSGNGDFRFPPVDKSKLN